MTPEAAASLERLRAWKHRRPRSAAHARELLRDPEWLIPRLQMIDRHARRRRLGDVWTEEQQLLMAALMTSKRSLVLKPRQIGATTSVGAYEAALAYQAPLPVFGLSVTHDGGAQTRINNMVRTYLNGIPEAIRPEFAVDNGTSLSLAHNGATMNQLMAGGRGQGRSWTYHFLHFTEMGFYPMGSAATAGDDEASDEAVYASLLSTQHEGPEVWCGQTVIESTARGPRGLFYRLVKEAQAPDSGWTFLFFPWFAFANYERDVADEAAFLSELDDDERRLLEPAVDAAGQTVRPALSLRKLAWRRHKLRVDAVTLANFKRDFPETWIEPFRGSTIGKFFQDGTLDAQAAGIAQNRVDRTAAYTEHVPPRAGVRYVIGVDTAGGVGRDWSVATVVDEAGTQVAVFRSNRIKPVELAPRVAMLSARYNGAVVICEGNKYGKRVNEDLASLGIPLWTDPVTRKPWWTQTGANNTKKWLYDYLFGMIVRGWCRVACPVTLAELDLLIETDTGDIRAAEGHDDHADAFALAIWALRTTTRVSLERAHAVDRDPRLGRRQ